ncbi:MAG: hypothetical protein HN348_06615 [Proteobacteria bacterium]|nr:hypothetical protein [Pseudomonadota bacterium]
MSTDATQCHEKGLIRCEMGALADSETFQFAGYLVGGEKVQILQAHPVTKVVDPHGSHVYVSANPTLSAPR